MDLLKAEMERKRKAVNQVKNSSSKFKKVDGRFMKRGDILRAEEELEYEDYDKKHKKDIVNKSVKKDRIEQDNQDKEVEKEEAIKQEVKTTPTKNTLSPNEITIALRSLGLPIRLFGEITKTISKSKNIFDDTSRLARLNAAKELTSKALATMSENDEFRLGSGHGIRNPFLDKRGDEDEIKQALKQDVEKKEKKDEYKETSEDDPHKQIHHFFKSLLKQWEDELSKRPESTKRTITGKNETKTLKQCKDYIRPLFKLCKNRKLEPSIMSHLLKIVTFCQEGEFVKAHDAYVDVSIGRAAWPIGVTMVGIHARTGRAKIESANVAHVMNSEVQRKYLTSVKRLMSYCQKLRPDVDPSKKVLA